MPSWRLVAAALALAGYAWLSYALMVHASDHPWAVAALFGPLLLAIGFTGWRRRHRPTLAVCAGLFVALATVVARGGVDDVHRMYVLQHAGIHLALAWVFGVSLRAGETPLITALARQVHREFTPDMQAYTRRLTGAWVGFFLAMVLISWATYGLAPWPWWSLFCNVFTPLAAIGFFVVEHVLRYRWHPEFERASLSAAWQAWRRHSSAGAVR